MHLVGDLFEFIFLGFLFVALIERITDTVSSSEVILAKYLNGIPGKYYMLYDDTACALSGEGRIWAYFEKR